jgi:hypothetical protein
MQPSHKQRHHASFEDIKVVAFCKATLPCNPLGGFPCPRVPYRLCRATLPCNHTMWVSLSQVSDGQSYLATLLGGSPAGGLLKNSVIFSVAGPYSDPFLGVNPDLSKNGVETWPGPEKRANIHQSCTLQGNIHFKPYI